METSPDGAALVIRRAVAGDAPALERLYRELVADPLICVLPEQVAAMGASAHSFLLVAENAETVCGTALLSLCADAMYHTKPFGVVENVVVAAPARARGVGRGLLARLESLAAEADCTKLMLSSNAARVEAHQFFRKCGFAGETKRAFVKYRSQFALR